MRLSGTYFELTDRFAARTRVAGGRPAASRPVADRAAENRLVAGKAMAGGPNDGETGTLVISVAKRLVASAVRRNTVKRIVREAWRAAKVRNPAGASHVGSSSACLVRLKRYPGGAPGKQALPRGARRRGIQPGETQPGGILGGTGSSPTLPGFAAIKRQLRADADRLFEAFLKGRSGPKRLT